MRIIKKEFFKGKIVLYLDNGEKSLPLLKTVFYESGFKIGSEITDEELFNLTLISENKRAYQRALYYLSRSNMSSGYLFKKLKASFLEESAKNAVDMVLKKGYINDTEYAESLSLRLSEEGRSLREITEKMYLKGVKKADIEYALSKLTIDENAALKTLIYKKYKSKLFLPDGEKKVSAALMRRGFSYDEIKKAIKEVLCENE